MKAHYKHALLYLSCGRGPPYIDLVFTQLEGHALALCEYHQGILDNNPYCMIDMMLPQWRNDMYHAHSAF